MRRLICERLGPAVGVLSLILASTAGAEIVTDGTVGPHRALSGADMRIGADLGTIRGDNLFHSFQSFDIQSGEQATFTGPDRIRNVISRVTGGKESTIDGQLRSEVGQADVYLINPAGVILGPNAEIDVPAAFHASTADEMRFSDGTAYSATDPGGSSLSMATPESFGFLAPQPASISVDGSQLSLASGQTLSLTAGDLSIRGADSTQRAEILVPAGEVRLEAVEGGGTQVSLTGSSDVSGGGTLSIVHADISTDGDGSGLVSLRAGEADLTDAWLSADNFGDSDASGGLDIGVTGQLSLREGSALTADAYGEGGAGAVSIQTGSLLMDGAADPVSISSETLSTGDGGQVRILADESVELRGDTYISTLTAGLGAGGDIEIEAGSLRASGDGGSSIIVTSSLGLGAGDSGAIGIRVDGLLELLDGSTILSFSTGEGSAGDMSLQAGAVRLVGGSNSTGIDSSSSGSGDAADIHMEVEGSVDILDGAFVSSDSYLSGDAGSVTIDAQELNLDGRLSSFTSGSGEGGDVAVKVERLRIEGEGSGIFTAQAAQDSNGDPVAGEGNAGTVELEVADTLDILNGGQINSSTAGEGDAGRVTVRSGSVQIDRSGSESFTGIQTDAKERASGDAGEIEIQADKLALLNGGQIRVEARQTEPDSAVGAGLVRVEVGSLYLNASQIDAESTGKASASPILIQAGDMLLTDGSRITTAASQADGGSISIDGGTLRLFDSQITTSVSGETGNGGDIVLTSEHLVLDGGFIQANTAASGARGGDILVDTRVLIASRESLEVGGTERQTFVAGEGLNLIQAAAPGGEQGRIQLTAPNLDISASLVPFGILFADPDRLILDPCDELRTGQASALFGLGAGGVPRDVGAPAAVSFGGGRLDRLLGP